MLDIRANEKKMIELVTKLEPVFEKAGKLACDMQSRAISNMKYSSGEIEADIVTDADLEVQEMILKEVIKTELVNCILLAEEDTPTVKQFSGKEKLYLTLDPINGTSLYAEGLPYFNLIVGLHNDKDILYTYFSCPKIGWATTISRSKITHTGQPPSIDLPAFAKEAIIYSYGDPKIFEPKLYKHFADKGYKFVPKKTLTAETGSTTLLIAEKVAGFYIENPNDNDGLTALHFALAKGYEVKSTNAGQPFSISTIKNGPAGLYHPGCYFVAK